MKESNIRNKSYRFAVRAIKLYQYLTEVKKEYVLSKQLLRSGTSIGANVREAENGESKLDFIHKLAIAQKETDETIYWLELLKDTDYVSQKEFESMNKDATELLKIIRSIIIKTKMNIKNNS
jgi:four helix bundle protein